MKQYVVGLRSPHGGNSRYVFSVGAKSKADAEKKVREKEQGYDPTDCWVREIVDDVQHICSYPIIDSILWVGGNMELYILRHRIDSLVERLESATNVGNTHNRNNHIYILKRSMDALEEGEPEVWSMGISNTRLVADIDGLRELADRADKYLERLAKKGR